MRLAVFAQLESPWAREAILRLVEVGMELEVIDFASSSASYLGGRGDLHAAGIEKVRGAVRGLHWLETRLNSELRYFFCAPRLKRICQSVAADALLTLYGGGWATMSHASGFRPFFVFAVGSDVLLLKGLRLWVSRHVLSRACAVFANGVYLAERTQELAPRANVIPLYLGIDTERFSPGPPPGPPVRIVCTRGFSSVYNNDYLIQGLAAMPALSPECSVVFTSPGELLEQSRALAECILPEPRRRTVRFLDGVTDAGIIENLRQAHVYVSLSRSDGASISLLEALACGLFPVLSDIPQNREWIDPALGNGLLVPLDQPDELGKALLRAISDEPLRRRAAEVNRRLVVERADGRKNMALLAEHLESLIAQWHSRGAKSC